MPEIEKRELTKTNPMQLSGDRQAEHSHAEVSMGYRGNDAYPLNCAILGRFLQHTRVNRVFPALPKYWLALVTVLSLAVPLSSHAENSTNVPLNGQHYSILNHGSGKVLEIGGDTTENDGKVIQRSYEGSRNSSIDERTCEELTPVVDYGEPGPFREVEIVRRTGPNRNYTLFRPAMGSLGEGGFKHPIATWGNGIFTTPNEYQALLTHIASHGFVIIACNDIQAERSCLSAGLDWLNEQNEFGPMAGMLDTTREVSVGYSWGGGAAIDVANRPNMKATVSLHGMPPRETTAFDEAHTPLLLITSTGDSFVTKDKYVTPTYNNSEVQTFYATLNDSSVGHLYVIDIGAVVCLATPLLGACGNAQSEQAPTVAWLRMLACGDQYARNYFYGRDCTMCLPPWTAEKKLWPTQDSP
jgi:hypothetical protein